MTDFGNKHIGVHMMPGELYPELGSGQLKDEEQNKWGGLYMWHIIRLLVSAIVIFETAFAGLFNGILFRPVEMPEAVTGEYTQYVDPFIGTGGTPWTCGMVSPAATVPFGAVRLGPDTSFVGGAYIVKTNTSNYYYEQRHIRGFSHSRLSGTGAEDYGIFRVTPVTGK